MTTVSVPSTSQPVGLEPSPPALAGPSRRSRQAMWLMLLMITLIPPLFAASGRYISDTRDPLWFAPGTYLSRSLSLWQPSPYLGNEQHDGLIVPMGAFVGTLRGAGLPIWVTERLWHGLLMFVAAAGMVVLIERLRRRRTLVAPSIGALLFTFTPFTFGYGLPHTGTYAAYALLPWLLYVTARGLESRRVVAWGAWFGLVTFLIGGANGAPQAYSLVPVAAYWIWAVAIERSVPARRAVRFAAWSAAFAVGLNAYWLFLLSSQEVSNALAFTEQPQTINAASSLAESIRGLGFWGFYGPWLPVVERFATSPAFVLASFAVPVGAVASAWLVRWRLRLLFVLLMIVSALLMVGLFPLSSPSPWARLLEYAYAHVRGAAGLRTTYKLGGALELSTAILFAVGVEEALAWLRRHDGRMPAFLRAGLVASVALVLIAAGFPVLTGTLYAGNRPVAAIPSYWRQALRDLAERDAGYRDYFAPGALKPFYTWGELNGVAGLPWLSSAQWSPLPVGTGYGSDLLTAIEQPYQAGITAEHSADLLRYAGVKDVVLQNDLDWRDSVTARPASVQTLVHDPSLTFVRSYGNPGENAFVAGGSATDPASRLERQLPPVQVLAVADPLPVVRAEAGTPVVVSGDAFGLAAMARAGMLGAHPPILYSGSLSPQELQSLAAQHASFVITDSNRRRFWLFSPIQRSYSHTLPADQALPRDRTFGLFGDRTSTQTVAVYHGAQSITASGYGSPFELQPEFRPANAFDGNPKTAWLTATLANPIGAWIRIGFDQPLELSRIAFDVPVQPRGRRVREVRLAFSDGSSFAATVNPGRTEVSFAPRRSAFVKVTILDVSPGVVDTSVGFSEIEIPGVQVEELARVPVDLVDTASATPDGAATLSDVPLTFLFDRARTNKYLGGDEEVGLFRQFRSPVPRDFTLGGTVHLAFAAPDDAIDQLIGAGTAVRATSSGRFFASPRFRASQAVDGDRSTEWVPQGNVGAWIQVTFPTRDVDRLTVVPDTGPGRRRISALDVTFSDHSTIHATPDANGRFRVSFSSRRVSWVRMTVASVSPPGGFRSHIAIAEIHIPGVHIPVIGDDRPLPCSTTSGFAIDGLDTPVRPVGTVGQLLGGDELSLVTCQGQPLQLSDGWHELVVSGALQPDAISLSSAGQGGAVAAEATGAAQAPATPKLTVHPTAGGGFDIDVHEATGPFYLVIGQNYSTGWRASIGGSSLGPPLLLDGYSAAWSIDQTGSFRVSVRYGPQRTYTMLLLLSGLTLVVAIGVVATSGARKRRRARRR
jgi:arabinofuranan 3-O-arabinosyltransferase